MSAANVLSHNTFGDRGARAAAVAGWSGVPIPPLRISGFPLVPVVEIDNAVAERRLSTGQGPETDMSTLAVWEDWSADLGPMPPESAVAIVGFISVGTPQRALYSLDVLAGYGAGLLLMTGARRPSEWVMRECELAGVSLVWSRGDDCECVVEGRHGPIFTARRTVATRQKEELLFSHVIRSGLAGSVGCALRC
ncbi:hypothetical protein TUM20983_35040 [Mycobacterium antarcticum]|nr:hypothetical protein TUM20983_35040 [Mycolicibacterium sp. TUM20983]